MNTLPVKIMLTDAENNDSPWLSPKEAIEILQKDKSLRFIDIKNFDDDVQELYNSADNPDELIKMFEVLDWYNRLDSDQRNVFFALYQDLLTEAENNFAYKVIENENYMFIDANNEYELGEKYVDLYGIDAIISPSLPSSKRYEFFRVADFIDANEEKISEMSPDDVEKFVDDFVENASAQEFFPYFDYANLGDFLVHDHIFLEAPDGYVYAGI